MDAERKAELLSINRSLESLLREPCRVWFPPPKSRPPRSVPPPADPVVAATRAARAERNRVKTNLRRKLRRKQAARMGGETT